MLDTLHINCATPFFRGKIYKKHIRFTDIHHLLPDLPTFLDNQNINMEIVGVYYTGNSDYMEKLPFNALLTLVCELDNPYDAYAVSVEHNGRKLGYLPRTQNTPIFKVLQSGEKLVTARFGHYHPSFVSHLRRNFHRWQRNRRSRRRLASWERYLDENGQDNDNYDWEADDNYWNDYNNNDDLTSQSNIIHKFHPERGEISIDIFDYKQFVKHVHFYLNIYKHSAYQAKDIAEKLWQLAPPNRLLPYLDNLLGISPDPKMQHLLFELFHGFGISIKSETRSKSIESSETSSNSSSTSKDHHADENDTNKDDTNEDDFVIML